MPRVPSPKRLVSLPGSRSSPPSFPLSPQTTPSHPRDRPPSLFAGFARHCSDGRPWRAVSRPHGAADIRGPPPPNTPSTPNTSNTPFPPTHPPTNNPPPPPSRSPSPSIPPRSVLVLHRVLMHRGEKGKRKRGKEGGKASYGHHHEGGQPDVDRWAAEGGRGLGVGWGWGVAASDIKHGGQPRAVS